MNRVKFNPRLALSSVFAVLGILAAFAADSASAQSAPLSESSSKVVAHLGSVSVGQKEIVRMLQSLSENEREAVKANRAGVESWLQQRLIADALLKEAQSKGWAERPEVKARIDAATRDIATRIVTTSYLESVAQVPAAYPSELELKAAYEQGKAEFNVPSRYSLAQIFLSAPKSDAGAVAKARDEAKKLALQARSGNFASLAKSHSQDGQSAKRGGEVGLLALSQMLPEVRDAVVKLKPGQVSDPVQSAGGIHVLKVLDTEAARVLTFDEVKLRLQEILRQQRQQQLVQSYLQGLAKSGSLSIDSEALDAVLR